MNNDRELLELAAKAAGAQIVSFAAGEASIYNPFPETGNCFWNPLADDGDALRLAVNLGLSIHRQHNVVGISRYGDEPRNFGWSQFAITESDDATTRRAIVRAAAEIGKAMP